MSSGTAIFFLFIYKACCSFSSVDNKGVKNSISKDVLGQPNCKFEERDVNRM